jgi:CBS domain containing-hemolysin-like protein
MTDKDAAAGGGSTPEPPSRSGDDVEKEGWFDRLKSAIGIKSQASLRADLEEALAGEDLAESFTQGERAMLRNLLRLSEVHVADLMVPRADIAAVTHDITLGDLLRAFRESGHSRMPVYRETLDDPIGMVHIKDVMIYMTKAGAAAPDQPTDLAKVDMSRPLHALGLVRNVLFVPPSMPATALLANMQAGRIQMALVVDEYGGTDGVVSLEDIVEAVFGEIDDEHDDVEGPMVVAQPDGTFIADARADLEEVSAAIGNGFGKSEDSADVDTVGGLVFHLIGRIPLRGELIAAPGDYELEILDADPRRIKRLRIRKRAPGQPRGEGRRRQRPSPEAAPGA